MGMIEVKSHGKIIYMNSERFSNLNSVVNSFDSKMMSESPFLKDRISL